jgi:hypothetical protein
MLGNKYVAIGVGVLLILVLAYNFNLFTAKDKQPETVAARGTESGQRPEPSIKKIPERIVDTEDKGTWKRDPFGLQALSKKTTEKKSSIKDGIHLMGIIKRDGRSHALINGKVYGINDKVGDVVIKDIKNHGIVILSDGITREISFEDYVVLKGKTK